MEKIFRLAKVRYAVMTNIPYVEDRGKYTDPKHLHALPDAASLGH